MARKILYFLDSRFFGGTEQALLHLLAGLDRQSWQPVLLHHAEPGIAPLIDQSCQLSVQTRAVPTMRGIPTILGFSRFFRQLIREKPLIMHAQLNWLLSCKLGILAAALARIPVVATVHQFMEPPWGKSIFAQQQLLARCVDQYIAVSNAVARQLCESFQVPAHKVTVIPNTIPVDQYQCRQSPTLRSDLGLRNNCPVVLTVARLDKQKGHTYLLEAIRQVPGAIFLLAGSGPERSSLELLAEDLGIIERVRFLGHREDIPELLACCDLFVLPSIYEGLPLSILEAMAAGKAVVATDAGGTPELVRDGETGFLVARRDPAALASAINRLISDPESSIRMGEVGKAKAEKEFSTKVMVQRITQVYEELLDSPKKHIG